MATQDPIKPEFGTLPQASRVFGIGVRRLRQKADEGAFPLYTGDSAWPRVKFAEVEAWLRSTRVPVTKHAAARVDEVLEREERRVAV